MISVEEELKILRRQSQERFHAPPPSTVVTKLLLKKPVSLECFRSLQEKEALLDEAISSGNGDAILIVGLASTRNRPQLTFHSISDRVVSVENFEKSSL